MKAAMLSGSTRSVNRRPLQINPEPLKIVSAAQRDVWTRLDAWRCDHEDGRGRCTSRETRSFWNPIERYTEHLCERHAPKGSVPLSGS